MMVLHYERIDKACQAGTAHTACRVGLLSDKIVSRGC